MLPRQTHNPALLCCANFRHELLKHSEVFLDEIKFKIACQESILGIDSIPALSHLLRVTIVYSLVSINFRIESVNVIELMLKDIPQEEFLSMSNRYRTIALTFCFTLDVLKT